MGVSPSLVAAFLSAPAASNVSTNNPNWCCSIIPHNIHISTSCEQHLHNLMMTLLSCYIHGCYTKPPSILVCTSCKHYLHHSIMSFFSCNVDGCFSIVRNSMNVSTSCSQNLHNLM